MKIYKLERINIIKKKLVRCILKKVVFLSISILVFSLFSSESCSYTNSVMVTTQPQATYTVVSGDSLWKISQQFNTTINELVNINNLSNTNLYIGQVLRIPQEDEQIDLRFIEYTVKSGDTLGMLAEHFGTTITSIKNLNGLTNDIIYTDQFLRIPAEYTEYEVVSGDTLYGLSLRYGTTVNKIMLFNNMSNYVIYIDEVIRIPYIPLAPKVTYITHTVEAGETTWSISIRYGIPNHELMSVNNLSENSILNIGQQLTIPVYTIPIKSTPGSQYGEYVDWWTEAQYLYPIGKTATVIDFETGITFNIERTIGASHADCEPLTPNDTQIIKDLWGGKFSWVTRAVIIVVDGRRLAASMSSMPHGMSYLSGNNFDGHFDIYFKNSRRHVDHMLDPNHAAKVIISAGIK
ncbi:UNVERIFIED_CONTAM: LysM repeat protein [Acetivibrio alkalicellulosi]